MKKRLFIIAVAVIWLFSAAMAFGAPVGKFTAVKGLVDLTATDGSLRDIKVGDSVSVGDIVRTKSRSSAEITFADSSVVRLARNSRLKVNEYMVGKQETRGILKLFRGKAQSIVSKAAGFFGLRKKNKFEMHTPTAVCGVRGTNFFTWYQEGVSGSAVREGTVYTYANNRPQEVKEVHAGQSSMVVSSDAPPVIRKATDEDLSLGGDEEGGEPFAFVEEADPEALSTFGLGVSASDTEEIKVEVPDETTPDFEVTLANGFLDGTLSGYLDDGVLAFSGTHAEGTTAGAMAVGGALADGGAFEGYLGGALGSWEGLFASIYVDANGGAGFITGALSDANPSDNKVNARGHVKKDEVLGFVRGGDQAGFELELDDWTYPTPAIPGTGVAALALVADGDAATATVEGIGVFDAARVDDPLTEAPDRLLGIYSETGSGFLDLDAGFGSLTRTGAITYEDDPMAYYLAGYVQVGNDEAGHVSISDYGKLSYLDPLYHGTYTLGLRGVYDTGTGIGDYASAGTIELEPLDFSVSWAGSVLGGENNLFYDDMGSKGVAAAQYGILGFVDNGGGYDLYAAGDYSAAVVDAASVSNPDAPLLWHSFLGDGLMAFPILGAREAADAGPENGFMGFTAGLWRMQGGYGVLDGAVAGIRMTSVFDDQGETLVAYELERVFGGLGGDFFPDDLTAPNLSGLWRAEGVAQADTMTVDPDNLFMHEGVLFAQLAGAFVDDNGNHVSGTDIQGAGMGMALSFLDFPDGDSTGIFTLGLGNLGGMGSILTDFQEVGAFDVDPSGMSGNFYTGSPGAWTARIGGMSSGLSLAGGGPQVDSLNGGPAPIPIFMGNDIGFFLATVQNGLMGEGGDVTGYLDGTYMTLTHMAHLDGLIYGQQTAGEGGGTWIAHSVGIVDNVRLFDFSGTWGEDGEETSSFYGFDSSIGDNGAYVTAGHEFGLLGGISNEDGSAQVVAMGRYQLTEFGVPGETYGWISPLQGGGVLSDESFAGYTSGIWGDGAMGGSAILLLIDEENGTSFLKSTNFSGNYYDDIEMWELGGTLSPGGFSNSYTPENSGPHGHGVYSSYDRNVNFLYLNTITGKDIEIDNEDWWMSLNTYNGDSEALVFDFALQASAGMTLAFQYSDSDENLTKNVVAIGSYAGPADGGYEKISGDAAGSWVNWNKGKTGVSGGEIKGVFDPSDGSWKAVAAWTYMDTETFLATVQNNPDTLVDMNIPSFEVGRADLTGSGNGLTVTMADTTFFAYLGDQPPSIWASGSVTGTNSGGVTTAEVPVSGNGLNATFNLNSYAAGGNWTASVDNGYGSVGGHYVSFHGAAAGQAEADNHFTGTASGVAVPLVE